MDGLSRLESQTSRDLVRVQHFFVGFVRDGSRFDDSTHFFRTPRRLFDCHDDFDLLLLRFAGCVPCEESSRRCERCAYRIRVLDEGVHRAGAQLGGGAAQHAFERLGVLRRSHGRDRMCVLSALIPRVGHSVYPVKSVH